MKMKKIGSLLLAVALVFSSVSMASAIGDSTIDTDTTKDIESYATKLSVNKIKKADLAFVIDSTGSMGDYIGSVKRNLTEFMKYLKSKKIDLNICLVDYKDITNDGPESSVLHSFGGNSWTSDIKKVVTEFDRINVDGGGDTPETPTDGFRKLPGIESWRDDAQHFVFLLTDANYKGRDDDKRLYNMDEWAGAFRKIGMHTTVVSLPKYEKDYKDLYTLTGGKFIDISSSDYYKLMIDIADWIEESLKDTDGDGLPDAWEINGVDTNGDGKMDLDLKSMGADPNIPDIFVEIDWMYRPRAEGNLFGHKYEKQKEINLKPSSKSMKIVYDQFKNHGINLHIDAGSDSVDYVTGKKWGSLSGGNVLEYQKNIELGKYYENWNKYALDNFSHNRLNVFRYAMFINKFDGHTWSGISEAIPGQFLIVADVNGGVSSNDTKLAGTFMHELGHTLGLKHGGDEDLNHKANYLSIMNYNYQFSGLLGTNEVNYSEYELPEINESDIDERKGVDPYGVTKGQKLGVKWFYRNLLFYIKEGTANSIAGKSIDFNKNGDDKQTGLKIDLNDDGSKKEIHKKSIKDWQHLSYKGGCIGNYGAKDESDTLITKHPEYDESLKEMTYEEAINKGLVGNPGDCEIGEIGPKTIYSNIKNEKLIIKVNNLGVEKVIPTIRVKSNVLDKEYIKKIEIEGNSDSINSISVEIPLKESITEGSYSVECELECENGLVETKNGTITVSKAGTIEAKTGDKLSLVNDDDGQEVLYNWKSNDDCVTINDKGEMIANRSGNTVITGTDSEDNQIKFNVIVTDGKNNKADSTLSENQNTNKDHKTDIKKDTAVKSDTKKDATTKTGDQTQYMIYAIGIFVSVVLLGCLVFKRKKNENI